MSGGKDPFDFSDGEAERTVIRPAPAPAKVSFAAEDDGDRTMIGAAPDLGARPAAPTTGAFAPRKLADTPTPQTGPNPLIAAGSRLIALANVLRAATHHDDIPGLRQRIGDELRRFQGETRALGTPDDETRYAHYALCALIDEVILSAPWGAKSGWGRQTLVATFHNEVVSGDRMFEIAEALEARPNRSPNLLELIYLCLSFGFEGRLRLERQGASRLFAMRERIFAAIQNVRGPFERALSPRWRGADAAYQPVARQAPLWVFAAAFAAAALLIYLLFLTALSISGSNAVKPLSGLFAAGPSKLNRTAPAPASDTRLYDTVLGILKPDIDAGRVGVTDGPDAVLVRLKDKGLFASGSADLDAAYDGTMQRVAQAIALTVGPVPVTGHTDDKPVRSLRFASNQALSDARAETVVGKLAANGTDRARLQASGLGESQPVASNADDGGRRQNRRVEVSIPKTYADARPPA